MQDASVVFNMKFQVFKNNTLPNNGGYQNLTVAYCKILYMIFLYQELSKIYNFNQSPTILEFDTEDQVLLGLFSHILRQAQGLRSSNFENLAFFEQAFVFFFVSFLKISMFLGPRHLVALSFCSITQT